MTRKSWASICSKLIQRLYVILTFEIKAFKYCASSVHGRILPCIIKVQLWTKSQCIVRCVICARHSHTSTDKMETWKFLMNESHKHFIHAMNRHKMRRKLWMVSTLHHNINLASYCICGDFFTQLFLDWLGYNLLLIVPYTHSDLVL